MSDLLGVPEDQPDLQSFISGGACLSRLFGNRWTVFFVTDSLVQDQPDQPPACTVVWQGRTGNRSPYADRQGWLACVYFTLLDGNTITSTFDGYCFER